MASMSMSCSRHEFLFGSPWNVAYMSCCSGSPYGAREPHYEPPARRTPPPDEHNNDLDEGDEDDDLDHDSDSESRIN